MRAVLVDVDGTLVDSNYHHAIAWSRALHDCGYRVPVVDIHRRVGMGGGQMLEQLIGSADPEVERRWRRNFEELVPDIEPIAGAAELLRELSRHGLTVVLATSSPADLLDALRKKVDADDAIAGSVDADDVREAKPEPDVFAAALDKAGVRVEDAVVLGDSTWDIEGAARVGLGCVALETGGYGRAELEAAGALAVYRDPCELLDNLSDSALLAG